MASYIVTGGAGFIGSNLAKKLVQVGHKVYILDDLSKGFERNLPQDAIFYKVDLKCWENIESLVFDNEITAVYHFAAQSSGESSFDDPAHDIDANYKATYHILKLCKKIACKRFLFASSMSVYGEIIDSEMVAETYISNPTSYYGLNKLASENLIRIFCKNTDIKPTCFRLFNVYGQGQNMNNMKQGMVSIYLSFLIKNQVIQVKGSLDRFRDFVFVDDVVEAFLVSEHNFATFNENINLGTGVKTTVKQLLETILSTYKIMTFEKQVKVGGMTAGDVKGCVANTQKLEKLLNWKPKVSIEQGISQMKAWLDQTANWWI